MGGILIVESYIQLPADGAGKKVRTIQKIIAANPVQIEQQVADSLLNFQGAYTICLRIAGSASVGYQFLSFYNAAGSERILKIKGIKLMVDIGSVANQVLVTRTTSLGTGTSETAVKKNSAYSASVASISSVLTVNAALDKDVVGIAKGTTATLRLLDYVNWDAILERDQLVLREGEGIVVQQLSAGATTEFLSITVEWEEYTTS